MHKNVSERKQGQSRQGQCVFGAGRGTEVCQIQKYPDNLKKYLPKKADCMLSYRYNSFQVGMVDCYWTSQFYHKPVRSCAILAKKKARIYAGYGVSQTPKTEEVYERIRRKAEDGEELTEEELMEMVILPLTVKGKEKKRELLRRCVEIAEKLKEEQEKFTLSGLITFTDKIIDRETAERIRRRIEMTKIGMLYEEEKREAVRKAVEEKEREKEKEKEEAVKKIEEEKQEELEEMRKVAEGSCKERNILRRLLQGRSVKETAEEFGVSEQKVIELIG